MAKNFSERIRVTTGGTSLPTASNLVLGGVKVDNSTITISNGVIRVASSITTGLAIGTTLTIPTGNTESRPTATRGNLRFNTDLAVFEGYNGIKWGSIGGGSGLTPTDIKTLTGYTAAANDLVRCNTTSGAFSVTLPASPADGDIIGFVDTYDTFNTYNLTILAAGSKNIEGDATSLILDMNGAFITLFYNLASTNWIVLETPTGTGGGSNNVVSAAFTMASSIAIGGTLTLAMSGTSALVGGSVASFEVTDWNGAKTTVAATSNAGTKTLTATTTVGQVLSVDVVAIDNYGNRSVKATRTTTVTTHTAPTGTITVNKASTVIQGSAGNQISFSGGVATDGATITYQINALASGITFSKTTAIASGEVVTFTAPASAVAVDLAVSVQMNDSLGASSTPQAVTISEIIANIVGVQMTTTGGNGGTWAHIDAAGAVLGTQLVTSNFNSHPVFGGMVDQTIDGQAMVKVPKFYFKVGTSAAGKPAWWISDAPVAGFAVHPAFMNAGSEVAQFYYGKYQARLDGTKMTSLAGGLPQTSRTHVQFAADAAARNTAGVTGFMMHSFWQLSAIQMLYLIENKSMNSQATTGSGVTGGLGNVENGSANYRNIIGLWENAMQWLDGFKTLNGDIKTWDINGNKTWVSQGAALSVDSWHYPLTFKSNNNLNAAFIGATDTITAAGGTSADGHFFYTGVTTTEYLSLAGGHYNNGADAGLWYMSCSNAGASATGSGIGSRLAKV